MAGNYSAMAADSQSTAASSPIGTMPLPLGQEARRENLAIGWNLEGHQESTQRSNLSTRLAAPFASARSGPFWLAEG